MRIFRDESNNCYTLDELKYEHTALVENNETELTNFNIWLADCIGKNGTLEEITALTDVLKNTMNPAFELVSILDDFGCYGLADNLYCALNDIKADFAMLDE